MYFETAYCYNNVFSTIIFSTEDVNDKQIFRNVREKKYVKDNVLKTE